MTYTFPHQAETLIVLTTRVKMFWPFVVSELALIDRHYRHVLNSVNCTNGYTRQCAELSIVSVRYRQRKQKKKIS